MGLSTCAVIALLLASRAPASDIVDFLDLDASRMLAVHRASAAARQAAEISDAERRARNAFPRLTELAERIDGLRSRARTRRPGDPDWRLQADAENASREARAVAEVLREFERELRRLDAGARPDAASRQAAGLASATARRLVLLAGRVKQTTALAGPDFRGAGLDRVGRELTSAGGDALASAQEASRLGESLLRKTSPPPPLAPVVFHWGSDVGRILAR